MYYGFLLNMWIMQKIDAEYLGKMVELGRITEEEKGMILATPQGNEYDVQRVDAQL